MRAWIISDIHHSRLDALRGRSLHIPDADLCICAGDVSSNMGVTIAYVQEHIEPRMPVVLVLGNHDYYHFSISMALERAHLKVQGTRVHLLENQSVVIGGCRFLGATLWTDFAVSIGYDEHVPPEERRAIAFAQVPWRMQDFFTIYPSNPRPGDENGMVTCREILDRHIESRQFIDNELGKFHDGPTIVVTHHAPLVESFDPRFHGQTTNAAFASDLSDLIRRRKPTAWIHGHIHKARDYLADGTRIICNPVGYFHEGNTSGYRPSLLIDL
ncbi:MULTISPECIES: metallophosphoesterase [unclassified Rhizobium]|uniref:metallophosphoesterase n=1 Tax=unclassified Rhizobium TaxID=2613769 RepID=UPI001AE6F712|nr:MULTISPECIES: metallophosphoesterase [unclassified Rhizobium]MBP2461418.1 Icc-related predicted phosphoesterase [Rhizobium sp. PvP014]MBP2528814.1 Icc-related predicted phosphoesterase [Rhizobium sp. PvP099]